MGKMMKLAGATMVATGEVAMSGIVASGAAAYSVIKGFQAAMKRISDAWKEDVPSEKAENESPENVQAEAVEAEAEADGEAKVEAEVEVVEDKHE